MSRKRRPQVSAGAPNTCLADSKDAIGIVRVSTIKQSDGNSPDVQQAGIEAYARRTGLRLLEVRSVYQSGKDSEARPLYRSAMDEALRHGNVIFWVWDRTGRNLTDHEQLEKHAKAGRLTVHIAHEGRVFGRWTHDADWLVADMSKVTAKQYSRELRRRCLEGMVAKAESG
ncbi:MAG TPA: recombinase family protein, partial [Polyangiaceae bacterium]|nr:recombinase family protein [Polyangiaceae bacterium]